MTRIELKKSLNKQSGKFKILHRVTDAFSFLKETKRRRAAFESLNLHKRKFYAGLHNKKRAGR